MRSRCTSSRRRSPVEVASNSAPSSPGRIRSSSRPSSASVRRWSSASRGMVTGTSRSPRSPRVATSSIDVRMTGRRSA
jgi:hypothetical protein